jgi:hypothetical protein
VLRDNPLKSSQENFQNQKILNYHTSSTLSLLLVSPNNVVVHQHGEVTEESGVGRERIDFFPGNFKSVISLR